MPIGQLYEAVRDNNVEEVERELLSSGNVNPYSFYLDLVCKHVNSKIVSLLLEAGADANIGHYLYLLITRKFLLTYKSEKKKAISNSDKIGLYCFK